MGEARDPATIVAEARVGEPPPPPPVDPVPPSRAGSRATTIVLVVLAVVIGLPLLVCLAGLALFVPVGSHQQAPQPPEVQSVEAPSR